MQVMVWNLARGEVDRSLGHDRDMFDPREGAGGDRAARTNRGRSPSCSRRRPCRSGLSGRCRRSPPRQGTEWNFTRAVSLMPADPGL